MTQPLSQWLALALSVLLLVPASIAAAAPDYAFDGSISEPVLHNYLARAVTHAGLCASSADPSTACLSDDIRMLTDIGAKFVGRAAFVWDLPTDDEAHFHLTKEAADKVHTADPDIILQAGIFEIVCAEVDRIPVPAWVFTAFDLPVETRNFRYAAMLYDGGRRHNQWRGGASVPDMSKLEARLWFYYRARRYLDSGIEALHFGQVMIMDDADPGHRHWLDVLTRIRTYARQQARRHVVLCDAHTHGEVEDGKLLFDFHSFPLRMREVKDTPQRTVLSAADQGDIFGRSKGGLTASGWSCTALPYLVELDNYGYSGKGGTSVGGIWVWGYDEISWFAHQSDTDRREWLRYANDWVTATDPIGHLQMPTRRMLAAPLNRSIWMYAANTASPACPAGFSDAPAIRAIWRQEKP